MKYYDLMDKEEKGSFITFENQYEAKEWLINQTKRFPQDGLHIVENERLTIYEKYEALKQENEKLKEALKTIHDDLKEMRIIERESVINETIISIEILLK
ncbi:MAG TPA: hypothetical protein VIK78_14430 [Ruminiclostridium sp.]